MKVMQDIIYLIYPREFHTQGMPVYKVGRSSQGISANGLCKRLQQYPKGSIQMLSFWVNNGVEAEREVIQRLLMCSELEQRVDIGKEYFEGSIGTIYDIMQGFSREHVCCFDTVKNDEIRKMELL